MEEIVLSKSKDCKIPHLGMKKLLSSFVSPNTVEHGFGTFRVPSSFHDQFGTDLPSRINLYCNNLEWEAKYDKNANIIYGMRRFIKFFGVKIYNLLQFDYYGEGFFVVRVFKDTAVESNYQTMDLVRFIEIPYLPNWKKDEYVLNASTMEYEKAAARWLFNAYRNYANYFEMKIKSLDVRPEMEKLRLESGLEKLYRDWKDGDAVVLIFVGRKWEIEVEMKDEICEFGNGWQAFNRETGLEAGDTLVFYRFNDCKDNTIRICIFKAGDNIINNRKDDGDWNISFLKVISGSSMNERMLVVPKCFKETYGQVMSEVNRIEIGGEQRFIFYSFIGGYLANIFQILDHFHVCPKETVIFTMDNSTILHGRVYQEDGREIDYTNRLKGCSISGGSNWIWFINWKDDIGKEKENVFEDEELDIGYAKDDRQMLEVQKRDSSCAMKTEEQESEIEEEDIIEDDEQIGLPLQFTVVLTKSNINRSTHRVYIPKCITPHNRRWKSGERVLLTTDAGSWTVGVIASKENTRFSAGWNTFAENNGFVTNQRLVFTMNEEANGIAFEVEKQ